MSVIPEITEWYTGTGEINALVSFTNNVKTGEKQNITVILAAYSATNKMVGYQTAVIEIGAGESLNVPVTLTAPQDAEYAKIYVWSGSELSETGETVYSKVVTRIK